MNQVKLLQNLSIFQSAISAWLSGKKEPSIASLGKLADFFDVSIDILVERALY